VGLKPRDDSGAEGVPAGRVLFLSLVADDL
jgi:hypothetical protein